MVQKSHWRTDRTKEKMHHAYVGEPTKIKKLRSLVSSIIVLIDTLRKEVQPSHRIETSERSCYILIVIEASKSTLLPCFSHLEKAFAQSNTMGIHLVFWHCPVSAAVIGICEKMLVRILCWQHLGKLLTFIKVANFIDEKPLQALLSAPVAKKGAAAPLDGGYQISPQPMHLFVLPHVLLEYILVHSNAAKAVNL